MARKKETKTQTPKPKAPQRYVHVNDFLKSVKDLFQITPGEVEGFKVFMVGKTYQKHEQDFLPYLEQYLGKKLV